LEHDVKRPAKLTRLIPLHDYSPALQTAVSWLGDRYLLAEAVPRRREERKPFFNTQREWIHAGRRDGASRMRRLAH
jgi:hypothetical protein